MEWHLQQSDPRIMAADKVICIPGSRSMRGILPMQILTQKIVADEAPMHAHPHDLILLPQSISVKWRYENQTTALDFN